MSLTATNASTTLNTIDSLATGLHSVTAGGQTFDAFVDNDGGTGWLLIGRGREGWEFDTDGQGTAAMVGQNLGTTAGFSPALMSDAVVNDIISNSGIDMTGVEVRLRRASNTGGTTFQEGRWSNWQNTSWTGDLDQGTGAGSLTVDWTILNGSGATVFSNSGSGTRDGFNVGTPIAGNNEQRVFTWAWGGHDNQQGFSYGQTVAGTDNNSPSTFMWENAVENHAIPYTEVYIRSINPIPEPGTALLGFVGMALMLHRRRA